MIETATSTGMKLARTAPLRPARAEEVSQAHSWLMQAIETSPFYNDVFKAYEKRRLSPAYLKKLYQADPAHIMLVMNEDEPVGFMISSPECGSLWLHWSYILPEKRRGSLAMGATRAFIEHWDNGAFHKISTYTKIGNETATAILERYGFKRTCTLENHIFGEDYLLYEKPLKKATDGYDRGISPEGTLGRLKRGALKYLGFARDA